MAAKYRRRNYFTKKGFQTRFVLPYLAASSLANILTVTLFIVLARNKIDSLLFSMRIPHTNAGALLSPIAFIAGLISVGALSLLFFWASRAAYRKIEGPLNSIREDLRTIVNGDLSSRVTLRKTDEFKDFAEEINSMTGELNRRLSAIKKSADELSATSGAFRKSEQKSADPGAQRRRIKEAIRSLEAGVKAFRL